MLFKKRKKTEYDVFLDLHNDEDYLKAFYANVISVDDVPNHLKYKLDFYINYFKVDPLNYFNLPLRVRKNISISMYGLNELMNIYNKEHILDLIITKEHDQDYLDICKSIFSQL